MNDEHIRKELAAERQFLAGRAAALQTTLADALAEYTVVADLEGRSIDQVREHAQFDVAAGLAESGLVDLAREYVASLERILAAIEAVEQCESDDIHLRRQLTDTMNAELEDFDRLSSSIPMAPGH